MRYADIMSTINSINRAAAALNVLPNKGVFTAKDFRHAQLPCSVPTLDTMRKRGAIVVDHFETFTVPAKACISIQKKETFSDEFGGFSFYWTAGKPLNVHPNIPDNIDIEDATRSGKLLAVLADFDEDVQKLFSSRDIDSHDCNGYSADGCYSDFDFNDIRVHVVFRPEYEGRRNFYRFDLTGFLKKNRSELDAAADRAEDKAARLAQASEDCKATAKAIRVTLASIGRMD